MNNFYKRIARGLSVVALAAIVSACATGTYRQRNLVSDTPAIPAAHTDPNLVNAWGVAFNPTGFVWVANNGTGTSTLYDGDGNPQTLVVRIPGATAGATGTPTGIVFYGGTAFTVTRGTTTGASRFIFASEDGGIAGWAPGVDFNNAIRVVNNGAAIYKGLAIYTGGATPRLYATDFRNARVDVFNGSFAPVALPGTPFRDPTIPPGYAPFGIQEINGLIYVSYARQDADREEEVPGFGRGYVSVFDPNGVFVKRLISRGALNAPWGLAQAPANFGRFSNRLLVGNFGDGRINAYDINSGRWLGNLRDPSHRPIRIDGLWGIAFGNGVNNQPVNTLFFAAGPDDEEHGLYGRIDVNR